MNTKFLMYMLTGNMLFLFLPVKTALMMMMLGGGGLTGGVTAGTTAQTLLSNPATLMLMSGAMGGNGRRYYSRPRTVVYNRRYYSRKRWR